MKPLVVYVAGPLSAATEDEVCANVDRACAAGKVISDLGHVPVIPHLTVIYDAWHDEVHGGPGDYETYLRWDLEILKRCDGLLFLGSSPGADRELAAARELGLLVWTAADEVPAA